MTYNVGDIVHIGPLNDEGIMQQAVVIFDEDNGYAVLLTQDGVTRTTIESICITGQGDGLCPMPPSGEWAKAAKDLLTDDVEAMAREVSAETERVSAEKAELIRKGRIVARDNGRGTGLEELFRRTGFTTPQVDVTVRARYGKPSSEHLLDQWMSTRLESACGFEVWVDAPELECRCVGFDPHDRVSAWLRQSYPGADFTGIALSTATWCCSSDDHDYSKRFFVMD